MQSKSGKPPRSARLATTGVELSRAAQVRLAWMDFYRRTQNVALTVRHFGISRQTFYRWLKRYEPLDLTSLEERSHCPHRQRRPTWSFLLERKVLTLRLQFPPRRKRSAQLSEPPPPAVPGSRRPLRPRPYAVRKPKQYAVSRPGDLVQVDTLDVRPVPGVVFKQFTARDVISRWDVIQAHGRATAYAASQFLETLLHRMPFPIRALQVDGGSEFAAEFEQACQRRGLRLFVLPPRSPKLNGAVERANRAHTEEFYQVTACSLEMNKLNRELRHWEKIYNTVRPHQSLGYLTPHQFLVQNSSQTKGMK